MHGWSGKTLRADLSSGNITFYDLAEGIAGDVLSVVAPRNREVTRVLFKG